MCFEFGCFGGGMREDYGGERSTRKRPQGGRRRANRRNKAYHGGGATDYKAPPAAMYHQQPPTAVDEAGHKANHDGAWKENYVGHGGYASYVQYKQADNEAPKLPAWHNKVGDDAGYTYTAHLHETPAGRRQNAAADYLTTTSNTTLVRY